MKLEVVIPSRGRLRSLNAVLASLQALESGRHHVVYTVLADEDDAPTHSVEGAQVIVGSGLVNARTNAYIQKSDADAFMPWADDLYPLAHLWDELISFGITKTPAFAWREMQDPENHTAIVLTRAWVDAVGRFFPEHFPFWFSDTWLKEVFGFLYGRNMAIIEQLSFSHRRTPTQGMRDLAFWFRVFARTRGERIAESRRIAEALGIVWESRPALQIMFEQADELQLRKVPEYEKAFGADRGEPTPAYLEAKAKAERFFNPQHIFELAA